MGVQMFRLERLLKFGLDLSVSEEDLLNRLPAFLKSAPGSLPGVENSKHRIGNPKP